MKRGVLYCVSGDDMYLQEAIFSAKSFKKYNKEIPITLFTNIANVKSAIFDTIIYNDTSINPFKFKISGLNLFPYEHTLFIDSDTKIEGSLYELFAHLDVCDIAIANRIKAKWKPFEFLDYVDESCYNTGIICYRKNQTVIDFFNQWKSNVMAHKGESRSGVFGDQHFFNKLIFDFKLHETLGLKITTLPNRIYNARHMGAQLKKEGLKKEVKIWHAHGLNRSFVDRVKNRLGF